MYHSWEVEIAPFELECRMFSLCDLKEGLCFGLCAVELFFWLLIRPRPHGIPRTGVKKKFKQLFDRSCIQYSNYYMNVLSKCSQTIHVLEIYVLY